MITHKINVLSKIKEFTAQSLIEALNYNTNIIILVYCDRPHWDVDHAAHAGYCIVRPPGAPTVNVCSANHLFLHHSTHNYADPREKN